MCGFNPQAFIRHQGQPRPKAPKPKVPGPPRRLPKRELIEIRDGKRCRYCGSPDREHNPLTTEHIIPKSRGGSNDIGNLTLACRWCNTRKGSYLPHEWPLWVLAHILAGTDPALDGVLRTGMAKPLPPLVNPLGPPKKLV